MKSVLILTNNMNGGGAERVLLTLLQYLPRDQYRVDLCLVYREGVLLDQLPDDINVTALFEERNSQTAELIFRDNGALYRKAAKRKYDIEIAFLEGNAVKIMSKSTNSKALKIAWVHIDLSCEHYTASIYESTEQEYLAFSAFDRIFCVSSAAQDGLKRLFGPRPLPETFVVFNPIDQERIQHLAREKELSKHGITFCAVGRLEEQKGFDRLLEAARQLYAEGFEFKIWLLGEGRLKDTLWRTCVNLHLTNNVTFLGYQQNPYPYIKQADALLSSSRTEGLSMVIGEALILRTPIIATNCSGQAEALQHGKYGLLVENSERGIYEGMKAFLNGTYTGHELMHSGPERYFPYQLEQYMRQICALVT